MRQSRRLDPLRRRAQEKVVTDRRDQREMDDIGARRARLAQTEDQDDGEQGGRS